MIEWKGTNTGIWLNLSQEESFKEQPENFKAANDIEMTEFLPIHPVYLHLVINLLKWQNFYQYILFTYILLSILVMEFQLSYFKF